MENVCLMSWRFFALAFGFVFMADFSLPAKALTVEF